MQNLIMVDIQFEYIPSLRYNFQHKSSTKHKMVESNRTYKGTEKVLWLLKGIHS